MTFHMLLILLHRPFLPEGHLRHLGGANENMHREICLSSAFQIYELAKLYRDTFTLRKATYMFSYCLFCAASIMPFGPSGSVDHSQRHIAGWFWIALKELQKGANFGLRRPIMIIRSLIEHAGLDLNSILAQAGSTSASALETGTPSTRTNGGHHSHFLGAIDASGASLSQGSNLDTQVPELDDSDFERLCRDLLSGDIDGLAAPHGIDDDDNSLLYGLFRQT
ncbi:hypothetical protein BGW36DRAFT_450694 [Talaromyces proteolyticus]|uniref:Transcription factor domain-containing protein n=1 Tax=Talaromyces proteolyticus TaxID=1131652 RepID=A0AAD4KVV0_9EURO|nr:uncharacterized protein BGW36DRAFT_450694 [Talaromyces proteolyticus]KAH8697930.1 hypothetical protein BGW36DRAFT_450694 [Talaromyces proteolyticus]